MPFLLRSRMILSTHCKEARTELQEYESQQVTLYGAGKVGKVRIFLSLLEDFFSRVI